MIDLKGKHYFITGGSRGIGAETARMAARAGASISLNYHQSSDVAQKLVAEIQQEGGKAFTIQADVAEDGALDKAVEEAAYALGPLNGMVVSAGIYEGMPIEKMSVDFWERTMSINLRGTFLAVRAITPYLRANLDGGSIVIYTSTAGQRGSGIYSAYATSKGAQMVFMRSMASELARDGIRVNCIAPAWTETEMATPKINQIGRDAVIKGFPLGRIGLPSDVAGATCYLLSDLASFITGTTLTVDGGMDMRG